MTTQSPVVHRTFSLERTYPVQPSHVFAAFANQETKRRWFAEGERWELDEFTVDFRVGGREVARFRFTGGGANGAPMGNDTIFLDIVPDQRIVFAYTMTVREQRISASLATVELTPADGATRLIYTEQGAFLDGRDQPESREAGWGSLLERLGKELRKPERR
jgi:uncharacterized protein YndB with AHSA1/START domain